LLRSAIEILKTVFIIPLSIEYMQDHERIDHL